jgi:hypothetical protein
VVGWHRDLIMYLILSPVSQRDHSRPCQLVSTWVPQSCTASGLGVRRRLHANSSLQSWGLRGHSTGQGGAQCDRQESHADAQRACISA